MLFTSIEITYKGISTIIDNMVIDTGAARTVIVSEVVEDIGIKVEPDDELIVCQEIGGTEVSFVKKIDSIKLEFFNEDIDFSNIDYDGINGLIGLDLLVKAKFILDLNSFNMYSKELNK